MNLTSGITRRPDRLQRLLKAASLLVLIGGFGTAVAVWLAQDRVDRQAAAGRTPGSAVVEPLAPDDSRRYTHDVEMYYGKTGALMEKWNRWLKQIAHGKPLAWAMVLISVLVANGLFFFATIYRPGPPE